MTGRVAGAARATTGTRANQEDAFAIWPSGAQTVIRHGEGMLAVVADGMGGHAGGEIAGRLACDAFVATFAEADGAVGDRLGAALEAANAAIAARAAQDNRLRGMGCTLIGAWIDADGLRWVSVGDSLLLLFRAPDVLRLNADHSLGAFLDEQVRRKRISPAEAGANRYRNALRSALTGKAIEIVDLQAKAYPLTPGDWLLLASDGIATLSGNEIGDIVYASRESAPEKMADRLIAAVLAKKDPDQDNTTVLALRIAGDPERVAPDEAPTRILKPGAVLVASVAPEADDGAEATRRPPAYRKVLDRYRSMILWGGMGLMFVIGWLLRAFLG